MTRLVNIWSGPRNVSTALMYAFRERADTTVVDEPLYAAYLDRHPEIDHPGRGDVLASQPTDPLAVVEELLGDGWPTDVVVAKQMAAHLLGLDRAWLDRCANVLLVRAPEPVVASYTEHAGSATVDRLGYTTHLELLERALGRGERPIVLETNRLLADPPGVLRRACELLDLPFDEAMLSWEPGPKPENGVWAQYWYRRTHESTGFGAPRRRELDLTAEQAAVARAARPLYEQLAAHAL